MAADKMGEEYAFKCRDCNRELRLIMGVYNCKGWGDRDSVSKIMDGKYGSRAKRAYIDNPHCIFHFQADVFQCQCGYTKSYDSLVIHDNKVIDPEIFFIQEHRCPRCRKVMNMLPDFPTDFQCPKCDGKMMMDPKSRFRWRVVHTVDRMSNNQEWTDARDELVSLLKSLGFPEEFGNEITKELGYPKAIRRLSSYVRNTRPRDPVPIVDEMLAIRSQIDNWKAKKMSEEANSEYNSILNNGL